jgi:hypothetical protein
MKIWFKRIALVLAVLVVAYVGVGAWYVGNVSQREETWHDEAIANSAPTSDADRQAATWRGTPRIELRYRPSQSVLHVVQIDDDGRYVSAVYPGSSDAPPLRIETGSITRADRRELGVLSEQLYAVHESVIQPMDAVNPADARLHLTHDNGRRVLYRYRTAGFAALPEPLRAFDARLFESMQSWSVRPPHGYARPVPALHYDASAIPALVRGLESDREALHASVVERLVAIGPSALPELTRVLREGRDARFVPASRYLAVVDGIGQLADTSSEGYQLVVALGGRPASTPGDRELQRRARQVVKQVNARP